MLPPAGQQNGLPWPDSKAPISGWTIAESFDTAKACEAALADHRKKFNKTYNKLSHRTLDAEFWGRFYVTVAGEATCIATDDPGLKDDAETAPSTQPSGRAN